MQSIKGDYCSDGKPGWGVDKRSCKGNILQSHRPYLSKSFNRSGQKAMRALACPDLPDRFVIDDFLIFHAISSVLAMGKEAAEIFDKMVNVGGIDKSSTQTARTGPHYYCLDDANIWQGNVDCAANGYA